MQTRKWTESNSHSHHCLIINVSIQFGKGDEEPMSELEDKVHRLWCSMLRLDGIPHHANWLALGGSSLSLMQLFTYYQFYLALEKQLNVLDFFINPTIAEHVRHLRSIVRR